MRNSIGKFFVFQSYLCCIVALACATPKKKPDPGQQYFESILNAQPVQDCHAQGKFFDFANAGGSCSAIPLAEWECSERGLISQMKTHEAKEDAEIQLHRIVRQEEYEMTQCGELDNRAYVTFSRRERGENDAKLNFVRAEFSYGKD